MELDAPMLAASALSMVIDRQTIVAEVPCTRSGQVVGRLDGALHMHTTHGPLRENHAPTSFMVDRTGSGCKLRRCPACTPDIDQRL